MQTQSDHPLGAETYAHPDPPRTPYKGRHLCLWAPNQYSKVGQRTLILKIYTGPLRVKGGGISVLRSPT